MEKKKLIVWMFIVVAMLLGPVSTASAAVSPWPMYGGNRFHTRSTSIVGPTVPVLKWSVNVGGWGGGEPSIGVDGNIYIGSPDVYLAAVSPQGSVVWQRTDHQGPLTPAVGANGKLYTYLLNRPACLDPNGEVVWIGESYLGTEISPTIAGDGSVYFNTGKYTPDGDLIDPGIGHRGVSEPRNPTNPDVYFTSCDVWHGIGNFGAYYVGLNDNNEPVWKTHWSLSSGGCTFRGAAVCSDGKVIVPDEYSGVTFLRAFSPGGDSLWTFDIYGIYGFEGMAIGSDGTIYAFAEKKIHAINPDGSTHWVVDMGNSASASPIVDGADTVYYRTSGSLIAVASDGSIKWTLGLPGGGSPPVFGNDGTMYIGVSGYLYAYDAALRLLTPNAAEDIMAGSTYTIQWETEGEISNVLIEYSTNNGQDWTAVDPPNTGNSGLYDWLVPAVDSNQCLVRISDSTDPAVYDTSNELFTMFICQGPIEGDLNNDCYLQFVDFAILGNQWRQAPGVPSADIAPGGGDGVVNFFDLALLVSNWLQCGNPFDPDCGLE